MSISRPNLRLSPVLGDTGVGGNRSEASSPVIGLEEAAEDFDEVGAFHDFTVPVLQNSSFFRSFSLQFMNLNLNFRNVFLTMEFYSNIWLCQDEETDCEEAGEEVDLEQDTQCFDITRPQEGAAEDETDEENNAENNAENEAGGKEEDVSASTANITGNDADTTKDTDDVEDAEDAEADVSKADASKADVSKADVNKADASKADASEADVSKADVSKADASKADASEAIDVAKPITEVIEVADNTQAASHSVVNIEDTQPASHAVVNIEDTQPASHSVVNIEDTQPGAEPAAGVDIDASLNITADVADVDDSVNITAEALSDSMVSGLADEVEQHRNLLKTPNKRIAQLRQVQLLELWD